MGKFDEKRLCPPSGGAAHELCPPWQNPVATPLNDIDVFVTVITNKS